MNCLKPLLPLENPLALSMDTAMEVQFPFFLLLASFFLFMVTQIRKGFKTKKPVPKLPPGPLGLPFIGSIHHLLSPLPHRTLWHLAKKHGAIMYLKLGQTSTVVVSSAEIAREIMKTHDLNFSQRPELFTSNILSYGYTDVAFAPYGDYWKQLRKICISNLLSAKRVESNHRSREEEVSNLIRSISLTNESTIDLTKMLISMTNTVTARAAFGKKCHDQERFLSALKIALRFMVGLNAADLFPSLKFVSVIAGTKFRLERIHRILDNILDKIIKEHKEKKMTMASQEMMKMTTEQHEDEDLVDVLLRLKECGDLEFPLTTDNIKAVILGMFAAGTETASTVMEWTMAELMKNPRAMEKAQAEVRKALKGKEKIVESDINELSYIKLVIKETMRLHPPLPLLPRESIEACEINGYMIPKKTRVLVNAWALARDPRHWENPETFEPERFSHNSIDFKGQNFEYIPFGAGRRGCPGILFGLASVELVLVNLLYYFDWKLPCAMETKDLDMTEGFGLTTAKKSHLKLIAIPHFTTT